MNIDKVKVLYFVMLILFNMSDIFTINLHIINAACQCLYKQ